jgi:hypothetical protein
LNRALNLLKHRVMDDPKFSRRFSHSLLSPLSKLIQRGTVLDLGTMPREDSKSQSRLIQQNEAAQARVRAQLERAGGELKPQRNPRQPRLDAANVWRLSGWPRDLRVEIRSADTEPATTAARGIARALQSCGLNTNVAPTPGSTWEGLHIESRADNARAAIFVQSAFGAANFSAGLSIHDRAAARRIIVHVGPQGLS